MTAGLLGTAARVSLSAGVMILAVLILRLQFQARTPRRVFCLLWDIVLCRLLILSDISSPLSVRRLLELWHWSGGEAAAQLASVPATEGTYLVEAPATAFQEGAFAASPPAVDWQLVLTAVWLTAALLGLGYLVWRHLQSRRIYAASVPVRDPFVLGWQTDHPLRRPVQIRSCGYITSPLTYGVLYPVVLLPEEMELTDREGLAFVLAHEYTHIRRFDTLRKGLLAGALCLHWFNPLVWIMYVLAGRDMELACDEAVVRSGADRREYALALLRLEEARAGLSGSYFSRNPLEERIHAIMKMKKISLAALLAVLVVMSVATTVFATSAPEKVPEDGGTQIDFGIRPKQIVEGDVAIISKGENGERFFSVDDGETWLTEDRYHAQYGGWGDDWDVEWWTADEFAAWLEQEKKDLQSLLGERAYTGSDGWFVWDQAKIDETIALYEKMLSDIQQGALYSKIIRDKDGNALEDVALGSDGPLDAVVAAATDDSISAADKEPLRGDSADTYALLAEAEPFGLTNGADGLCYNGKRVRMLVDGVSTGNGGYGIRYVYRGDWGEVDVHTLRSVRDNGDGSYDLMGDLIGLAAAGDANFDQELIDCASSTYRSWASYAEDNSLLEPGQTFQEIFAQYEDYGLNYREREWADDGRPGSMTFNGQQVASFADLKPDGGVFTYSDPFAPKYGLRVSTQYDEQGNLTGLTAKAAS